MKKIFFSFLLSCCMLPAISQQIDGPYVHYANDRVYADYVVKENNLTIIRTDSALATEKKNLRLHVNTDQPGESFIVILKDALKNEMPSYPAASKMLVLSDIEGNFGAFKSLLIGNGVIDSAFNWTFATGNLVLTGDFVDRGDQVVEVLWLIYSLEDKAKAAGGYVHYVLGNHEIMGMSGDLRYVSKKYTLTTMLLDKKYDVLFNEKSELGRWLRTKNIIERVGDNVFAHAGISTEMVTLGVPILDASEMARPYYADSSYAFTDKKLAVIFSNQGPFWYRGYYEIDPQVEQAREIRRALAKLDAKRIFTGHTIVGDHVSAWYNNKVINTDVHHAEGKSEAVLVEAGVFYRVNNKGERTRLFK